MAALVFKPHVAAYGSQSLPSPAVAAKPSEHGDPSPSPSPAQNKTEEALKQITLFLNQASVIETTFRTDKDVVILNNEYANWSASVEGYLGKYLDESYAVQFRNAPASPYVFDGMPSAAAGAWQNLEGKKAALIELISDLRRGK